MPSLKTRLNQIVERSFLPTDDADLRLKKVALTLVPLIIGIAAFVWGGIYYLLGHYLSGTIPMSYSVISAFSLAYFFKTGRTRFIQTSQLVLVLLLPFLLMWSLGGFFAGSMVMIWAIYAPVAALMFLEKRMALIWFFMYLVLILISVLIDDYVAANVTHLPELARSLFFLLNLGCGSAGLFLLLSFAFNEEKRANAAQLRIAASAFETQEGLMVTDANGVILRVNKAFTDSTGYTANEAVGQTPRLLKSDRHDQDFYRRMWQSIIQTGAWQGEIWDRRKDGDVYPLWLTISAVRQENGIVSNYVGSFFDISERKVAEEKIKNLAFYDPLTNLANRRLLQDRLKLALSSRGRSGKEGALLFIDLDNFKNLNDSLGHDIGDKLLEMVAARLTAVVREGDSVARLGGDEFVIMLEDLSEHALEAAEQTEAIGHKVLTALNEPYQIGSHLHRSTASIGATLFGINQSSDELLKQADIAMYQAKKAGRNSLRFFDPEMQDAINTRAALESDLQKAIQQQQFKLYYQIQVDSSHHPIGAEALIRWEHPERGLVSPAEFIPLAEETGLILPIGHWVLDTACAQIKAWEGNALTCNLALAVNISAKQFRQDAFVSQVKEALKRHDIKPTRLKLELTESLILEDIEGAIIKMSELKEHGIQISMDDFGTGYSSLYYLKQLPFDQIKIDQSFVRNIVTNKNDVEMIQVILFIAMNYELSIIAEGVETEAQLIILKRNGCIAFQGYYFGRPVPIEMFDESISRG